jgi:hypothetical protein
MTTFNLERAKLGLPMHTRNGLKAKFIAYLNGGQPAPLVVEIFKTKSTIMGVESHGSPVIENYYIDGRHGTVHDSEFDLFMEY